MPRFVILEHDHPLLHWDFMLEAGDVLRTWRLLEVPTASRSIVAEPLPDHRLAYLEYEGPIGGDRGTVHRWDAGEYRIVDESASRVRIELRGDRLSGTAVISATESDGWTFHCANEIARG